MKTPVTILAALVTGAVLAGIFLHQTGEEDGSHSIGSTYGQILVDSPEIYTRERMVNDRFRQEAWLLDALHRDAAPGIQAQVGTTRSKRLVASFSQNAAEAQRSQGPSNQSDDSHPGDGDRPPGAEPQSPQLSAIEEFRLRQAYREEVRNAIIENQLDDRHDLKGNTLYRLKFDVTIIPGIDTSAWARVRARFENRLAKDQKRLEKTYGNWVATLEESVNSRAVDRVGKAGKAEEQYSMIRPLAGEFLPYFPEYAKKKVRLPEPSFSEENHQLLMDDIQEVVGCKTRNACMTAMVLLDELKNLNLLLLKGKSGQSGSKSILELFQNPFVKIKLRGKPVSAALETKKTGLESFSGFLESSVFVYAVTPRESTQQISSASQLAVAEQLRATASAALGSEGIGLDAQSSSLFSEYARFLDSRPVVVGITNYPSPERPPESMPPDGSISESTTTPAAGTEDDEGDGAPGGAEPPAGQLAEFGWLIGPKLVVGARGLGMYRHHPSQNSLAALISVPSWWRRADITIETDWLDEHGAPLGKRETSQFDVALPGDSDELSNLIVANLRGRRPGPSITKVEPAVPVGSDGEPTRAEILIVGENLWRSGVVTIGSVRSKQISVLPNMKGIIAEFWRDELETAVLQSASPVLRVWTSEGVADISVSSDTLLFSPSRD